MSYEKVLHLLRETRYEQAFDLLTQLEEQNMTIDPDRKFVQFLLDATLILNANGSYEPGLTCGFYILDLCTTHQEFARVEAKTLLEIASAYYFLGMPMLSLKYSQRAIELSRTHGYEEEYASALNKVGLYYSLTGQYDSALVNFEKGLHLRQQLDDIHGESASLGNMGIAYEKLGRFDEALAAQRRSMALDSSIHNILGVAWSYEMLGSVMCKMGKFIEAQRYLEAAEEQAKRMKSRELLLQTYHDEKELLERTGKFEEALRYANAYQQLQDSIHSQALLGRSALLQSTHELNRKSKEIADQKATLSRQRNFILLGIAVAFIISVLASFYYRSFIEVKSLNAEIGKQHDEIVQKSRDIAQANVDLLSLNKEIAEQKEEIQAQAEELTESHATIVNINDALEEKIIDRTAQLAQAYKELDTFFYRASHDFRRPLTTFMGLSEVAKITLKDPYALELFKKVRQTADSLDKMLMKLQSISDVGLQQLSYKEVFSEDILNVIFATYGDDFRNAEIGFMTEATISSFYSYPTIIKVILENLVENAINFKRSDNAFVRLSISKQDEEIVIAVSDNGQGISEEFHSQIFNMYFRGSENSKGNGLGLYIVKKAAEKLGGRISFESVYNQGSTFFVYLPIG